MRKLLLAAVILLFTGPALANCPQFAYGGELPRTAEPHVILCKKGFAVGYSTQRKSPLWVAEVVDPEKITLPTAIESSSFKQDPALPLERQAPLSDFVGSGYDRGHLVPFENVNHSVELALESMLVTNVVAQWPSNNRGIWRVLEERVRTSSLEGKLFVVTGVIYAESKKIGGGTPVPSHLFKVIIDPARKISTTYIVPNISVPSSELPRLIFTRAELAILSGIDAAPIASLKE